MSSNISISQYAAGLREQLEIDPNSVIGDIVGVIKKGGYHYIEEPFGDDFSGFSEYVGKGEYLIGFNTNRDFGIPFKRFTLAHELGHVSIPEHQRKLFSKQTLHRSYEKKQLDPKELEAENFAAHFLAPSNACHSLISDIELNPDNIRKLSDHFVISLYAAALRIRELTNKCCTMIVCNDKGNTEYERRSDLLESIVGYKIPFVHKSIIHEYSLLNEFLKGNRDAETCQSELNYWYPDLPNDFVMTESVIDLGYNGKYMTLINIDDYAMESYIATLHEDDDEFRKNRRY